MDQMLTDNNMLTTCQLFFLRRNTIVFQLTCDSVFIFGVESSLLVDNSFLFLQGNLLQMCIQQREVLDI